MAEEEDTVFDRDEMIAVSRGKKQESQLTCNKLIVTVILCASFFGLGLCIALPGPTLKDLEMNTCSFHGKISFIFTSRSSGYLLGSIVGGVLFEYLNQACLLGMFMLATGIATVVVPFSRHLWLLCVMIMFQGISMGFLDTGGNLLCLETWGQDNGPYMQMMHFAFGAGAFLSPLIYSPIRSHLFPNITINETLCNITTNEMNSGLIYSYVTVAVFVIFVSFGFLLMCFCNRKSSSSSRMDTLRSEYIIKPERKCFRIQILILCFVFFFLYVGAEVTYGSLVSKFAVDVLEWSIADGALAASAFWGSFAFGRLLAIFIARCWSPTLMIVKDLAISTVSLVALSVIFGTSSTVPEKYRNASLIILSSTLGFGMASIFPSGISWVERYIKVTGKVASVFVVGSALGEMVLPVLTSYLYQSSPIYLLYVLLMVAFLSIFVSVILVNLACNAGERTVTSLLEEDMMPLRLEEDGLESSQIDYPNGLEASDQKKHVSFGPTCPSPSISTSKGISGRKPIPILKSTIKKE